jgi:hypothetical protein
MSVIGQIASVLIRARRGSGTKFYGSNDPERRDFQSKTELGFEADKWGVYSTDRALESRAISRRHSDRAASIVDLQEGTRAQASQCR